MLDVINHYLNVEALLPQPMGTAEMERGATQQSGRMWAAGTPIH